MPDALRVLLDQNIPREVKPWLESARPGWIVSHVADLGLDRKSDKEIFEWAQAERFVVITFDEDFADQRSFPVGRHFGVIRLRVWPTTVEEVEAALARLLASVTEDEVVGALVVIDRARIRVRRAPS